MFDPRNMVTLATSERCNINFQFICEDCFHNLIIQRSVPDSMFDTESCVNSTSKNSGVEPPMPRLPKPSQMNDEAGMII